MTQQYIRQSSALLGDLQPPRLDGSTQVSLVDFPLAALSGLAGFSPGKRLLRLAERLDLLLLLF